MCNIIGHVYYYAQMNHTTAILHNILLPFCLCTVGTDSSSNSSSLHLPSTTSSQLLASSTVHCEEQRIVNGLHVLHDDACLSSTYLTVQTMLSGTQYIAAFLLVHSWYR